MLAGLIRDDERLTVDGIPGLSDIPLVGRAFGHTQKSTQQTDIILTLTPHIIRVLDLTESDLRSFRVGRDAVAPLTELPLPVDVPRPEPATPAPTTNPNPTAPRTPPTSPQGPIFGPVPTPVTPPGR
jgi:general secretion pathway protein D